MCLAILGEKRRDSSGGINNEESSAPKCSEKRKKTLELSSRLVEGLGFGVLGRTSGVARK